MKKRDFTAATQRVTKDAYSSIIGSRQAQQERPALDAQAILDAQEAHATRGKKGAKMPRINLAFSPSHLDFIRVMAAIQGISMTQYVNNLIERERLERGEKYEAAKRLIDGD